MKTTRRYTHDREDREREKGQHTPGPWKAVWTTGAVTGWAVIPEGYNVPPIARVGLQNAIPEKREEMDARLIAAAPQLLEALRAMQETWDDYREQPEDYFDLMDKAAEQARAAIRLAEGGQK